jgi:sulfite oxidase
MATATSTVTLHSAVTNRPDEWKIEQGLSAGQLPILDQTKKETEDINPVVWPALTKDQAKIDAVGNRDELFKREKEGWIG